MQQHLHASEMPSVSLQRLASGLARPVATAQLKLLVSFTPVPDLPEGLTQPQPLQQAVHKVHRSSSSSSTASSSKEALSSIEGSSAQEAEPTEAAKCHASYPQPAPQTLEHQPQRRRARGPEASPKRSAPHKHVNRQPSAGQLGGSPAAPASIPDTERSAVSAAQAGQGRGQGRAGADMQDLSESPRAPALTPNQALSRLIERAEQLREVIEGAAAEGWAPDQPPASSDGAHALQAATEPAHDCVQSRDGLLATEGRSGGSAEALDSRTGEASARGHGQNSAFQSSTGPAGELPSLSDARDTSSGNAEANPSGKAGVGQGPVMHSEGHAATTLGEASSRVAKRSRLSRLASGSVCRPAARHCPADSPQPKVGCYSC